MTQTAIVKSIDGINFMLAAETREAAEAARITLTDLANALGYSNKHKLLQLAERHSENLNEFGGVTTVDVPCQAGARGTVVVQEPAYNKDQAAYLALSSETPQGRACRVKILKAYNALLAAFEQVVKPMTAIQLIAAQGQALAELGQALAELEQRQLEQAAVNQNAIVRLEKLEHSDAGMMTVLEYWDSRGTPFDCSTKDGRVTLMALEKRAKNIAECTRADVGRKNRAPTFELSVLRDLYKLVVASPKKEGV